MEFKFFCPAWGMTEENMETKLRSIREAGYDGVEMGAPRDRDELKQTRSLLKELDLLFIAQQWTTGRNAGEHIASFEEQIERNLQLDPLLINSHTGKDYFDFKDNLEILASVDATAGKLAIPVHHETHRGRFAFAAHVTSSFLEALPSLTLTADLSHWCCVAESLLSDQADHVDLAIERAVHIHARVGYREGPQVTDPRAPEWQPEVIAHLGWWDRIIGKNRSKGLDVQTITPEFGPAGYLHTLPFTKLPVADQWDINRYMKTMLAERYASGGSPEPSARPDMSIDHLQNPRI